MSRPPDAAAGPAGSGSGPSPRRRRRGPSRAAEIRRAARHRLGLADLRPGQLEAIEAAVAGRDVLAVMPTGYGKSAIYQVAGTLVRGPTIVVSPMIALQRDQVRAIEGTDAGGAAAFNSTQPESERRDALRDVRRGRVEFLLLAPEQLASAERLRELARAGVRLFVVDEAHCISEWGHDFRPDYLRLGDAIRALGGPTVLALTATASPPVRAEILGRLGIPDALVVARGFDRPNLWLEVRRFTDAGSKRAALVDAVGLAEGPGIVYAATRRGAEGVAAALRDRGVDAGAYHAGMAAGDRERAQGAFMDGDLEVMVATTAFGMGVDKPDVRFVFHHDVPGSVDAYYQEIGRAGRDGLPATAILFYRPEDLSLHRFFASSAGSAHAGAEAAAHAAQGGAEAAAERRRAFERSRIEMMRGYAEVHDCRREFLLNYFGEAYDDPCDRCDNCEAGLVVLEEGGRALPLGSRVRHAEWGEGVVQRYEGDKMVVLFDRTGYRTLAVGLVLEQGLLEPVAPFGPARRRGTPRKASGKEANVPATKKKDLPSTLKRSPAKAQRTWAETHDSAVETYGEGERAHRTAFASLKHSFKKVGDHWEPKDRKGPSDPQAARSGAAARKGGGKTYGGVDLYGSTKKELLEQARKLDVKGRSSMNKEELAEAVARKSR
jgi:ATP-dependent DNA helicase RecQ